MLDSATSTRGSLPSIARRATLKHLCWAGPATVALSVFAVNLP